MSMLRGYLRTARYARGWKAGGNVTSHQTSIDREGCAIPASLVLPNYFIGRLPAWVAVGGVSRMGRFHPQLVRFVQALASTGAAVLVPEIPEWRRLTVSPTVIGPTLRGSIDALRARPEIRPERLGAIGFSFGAPGLAIAASQDRLAADIAGIVLFGGYHSLTRTLECLLTGRHEWDGVDYTLSPDPYGRWVVASNHLTSVPGCEDASDVAAALHTLASAASGERVSAWEPHHDPMIVALRSTIPASRQRLFDYFATPTTSPRPATEGCLAMARRLADTCRRMDPLLEPGESLQDVEVPTQVIHGHGDRLVPFTEAFRLMEGVRSHVRRGATVTRLFSHSKEHVPSAFLDRAAERVKLFTALRMMINTV